MNVLKYYQHVVIHGRRFPQETILYFVIVASVVQRRVEFSAEFAEQHDLAFGWIREFLSIHTVVTDRGLGLIPLVIKSNMFLLFT